MWKRFFARVMEEETGGEGSTGGGAAEVSVLEALGKADDPAVAAPAPADRKSVV